MPPEYLQSLGYTFKYLRYQSGHSLRDLGDQFKVSHTLIANLEKGWVEPSLPVIELYGMLMGAKITLDNEVFIGATQSLNDTFEAILFHDFKTLRELKSHVISKEETFISAGLYFLFELITFMMDAHDYQEVHNVPVNFVKHLEKMVGDLNPILAFMSGLSLAMYDRYFFRLSQAKTRLETMASGYLNPHHKALVKDRLSDVYYHRFDRSKAIKYAQEVIQTYQTFHNTNRAILSDIKVNLYGKRQHQNEEELPYQRYIEQAKIYKLYEVINDISYVWALRVFRFKRYEEARNILEQIDLSHPQFYHYYVIVLFGSNDLERLKEFLKNQPLRFPMLELFKPALDAVNAYLSDARDEIIEAHMQRYLKGVVQEELYGETRWAETLLNEFYLKRRRYKDLTQLKEQLIKMILT